MRRGPGTEAAYRRLTESRLWSRAAARALSAGQAGGSTGSRASAVSDAVSDSASTQAAPKASPCKGRATQGPGDRGGHRPSPTIEARVGPEVHSCVLGPAQIQPARSKARQAARASLGKGRATQGRALPLPAGRIPGLAGSPLEGAPGGKGVAGPRPSKEGEGATPPPPGKARVGPGAHSRGVLPRFSLRGGRRAMGHGRRQAEAEQARDGSSLRSHPHLAKPWSGRNPTRVESRPVQAAWASPCRSRATQGKAQPLQSTGRAWSLLGWGPGQIQPVLPEARQGARALQDRSRAKQGSKQPLPAGRSPGRFGSPLGRGPAEVQPTRPKARNAVRVSPG